MVLILNLINNKMTKYKKGNVFRWSYTAEYLSNPEMHYPYHCKSQIAIVQDDGSVEDTYWCSDNYTLPLDLVELQFEGNLYDFSKCKYSNDFYDYEEEDIMNLTHANSHGVLFFIRKGAKKSKKIISDRIENEIKEVKQSIDYNQRNLIRLEKELDNIKLNK